MINRYIPKGYKALLFSLLLGISLTSYATASIESNNEDSKSEVKSSVTTVSLEDRLSTLR